jgi:hypothetical protein
LFRCRSSLIKSDVRISCIRHSDRVRHVHT